MRGVLLDVGGTLWPDRWPPLREDDKIRLTQIRATLPKLTLDLILALLNRLRRDEVERHDALVQDSNGFLREALRDFDLDLNAQEFLALREALCVHAQGRFELFPGASDLLKSIRALGLSCAVVTNATWRSGENYRSDFEDSGVSHCVDAFISSVDAGYRKPHPAIFQAALSAIRCSASECVMIGNSEHNDVQPALALEMHVIRVCIEEPMPITSAAHAVVDSLWEVTTTLRKWLTTS